MSCTAVSTKQPAACRLPSRSSTGRASPHAGHCKEGRKGMDGGAGPTVYHTAHHGATMMTAAVQDAAAQFHSRG